MSEPVQKYTEPQSSEAPPLDDHALLARVASGDRDAFAALVRRHQGRVLALAARFLGNRHAAEDVCQDAFVRLFENAARIKAEAKLSTWLYRVVANLCWDARRRRARAQDSPRWSAQTVEDAGALVERGEARHAVQDAVADLPDRQRLALVLHRFDELSQKEIAEITGWSVSAVESCLVRAYASLRERLWDQADS